MDNPTTDKQKPPIRFLRGDEVVVSPNGDIKKSSQHFWENQAPGLRCALGILPGNKLPNAVELEAAMKEAATPQGIQMAQRRVQELAHTNHLRLQAFSRKNIWGDTVKVDVGQALRTSRRFYGHHKQLAEASLRRLAITTPQFLETANEKRMFSPAILTPTAFVRMDDFTRDQEIFHRQPVLTDELARYLAYADIPILISAEIGQSAGTSDAAYATNELQGVAIGHGVILESGNPLSEQHYDAIRAIARALISIAAFTVAPNITTQKLTTGGRWKRISDEFNQNAASVMNASQQREDAKISGNYKVQDILSQIHFALHGGFYDPQNVRATLPECCAFYDEFMGMVKQRADELEKHPLIEPIQLPARERAIEDLPAHGEVMQPVEHDEAHVRLPLRPIPQQEARGPVSPFEPAARRPILEMGTLFLTPGCIRHAQQSREYKLLTYDDLANAPQDSEQAWDISQMIESFGPISDTLEEFKDDIAGTRKALHERGVTFKRNDGTVFDIDPYIDAFEADAAQWFPAIKQQFEARLKSRGTYSETPIGLNAREVVRRERKTPTHEKFHRLYNLKVDPETQALIAQAGIRFIADPFHEVKDELAASYDQNTVIFHPEFLDKPMAMETLRFFAIDIALKNVQVEKLLITLAQKEINEKWDTLPSHWKLPYNAQRRTIADAVLVQAMKEPELFRTLLPINYLAMHRLEMERQAAVRTLQGIEHPIYEATDTAFSINPDVLTSEQQAYFTQLNRIIADLGVSPEQFDKQFRFCANQTKLSTIADGQALISRWLGMELSKPDDDGAPNMRIKISEIKWSPTIGQQVANSGSKELRGLMEDCLTGCYASVLPDQPLPHEIRLFEVHKMDFQNDSRSEELDQSIPNFLQRYAAGTMLMAQVSNEPNFVAIPEEKKAIKIGGAQETFKVAMHNSIHYICEKKNIVGERKETVLAELATLESLGKQAFLWPDELAKIASHNEAAVLRGKAAAEAAARAEAARLAHLAAQAALPAPYLLPETDQGVRTPYGRMKHISGGEWKHIKNPSAQEEKRQQVIRARHLWDQIESLRAELNTKLPFHQELGDALFADSILRRAEYACSSDKEKAKLPIHADAFAVERAGLAIIDFFDQPLEGMSPAAYEQHERIRTHLLQAPVLLIAALGSDEQLRQLRALNQELLLDVTLPEARKMEIMDQRREMADALLKECGITLTPPADALATEKAATAEEEPVIETPSATEAASPEIVDGNAEDQSPVVVASLLAAESGMPLTVSPTEEPLAAVADPAVRLAAMQEAKQRLLDDIAGVVFEAQDSQFSFFECSVDVNQSKLPITLTFSRADGTSIKTALTSHYDCFQEKGLLPGLGDTVDLKMAVQSAILNIHGKPFSSPPSLRRGGGAVDVGLDTPLLPDMYDLEKHCGDDPSNPKVRVGRGGYSVVITVIDPYKRRKGVEQYKELIVPLGIASSAMQAADSKQVADEIDARKFKVLEILDDMGKQEVARSNGGTKRDVVYKLRSWIEEQGKVWGKADNLGLEGVFERPLILAQSPAEKGQKITLAPVHLRQDIGGENPSWRMFLQFYIGEKGKRAMGEIVRTRVVNLHTRNRDLAVARALESLQGVDSKKIPSEKRVVGFIDHLQDHMTTHPEAEWTVINKDTPQEEVMIGHDRKLQDFLDDMMRYEHDAGLRIHTGEPQNGRILVTFTAVRSLTRDYKETLPAKPEVLYLKGRDGHVAPAEVSFTIPADKRHLIERFARDTQDELRWFTAERYSPVAVASDEDRAKFIDGYIQLPTMEHARKRPQEYRTATIRAALGQAVEKNYEATFGQAWPSAGKPWTEIVAEKPRRGRPPKDKPWVQAVPTDKATECARRG